ncbi:hypothetical protein [Natrinema sp. 1APR25-10V2]|uniref:hypothetical protein n=1 Tax=Natrinema sp. 1APR25-10V2 TaxID=2951081 RepID=UPI002875C2CA|nr:hypothetical protein [Natrinema sp. 1APR25-10V2]MDS0474787.1 hypothetical protein [Natrinema sp. 1APR25-10V2]
MALVQLRVPDERVEAWDEFVEDEPEYDDRSDLIRKSVERTISTDTEGPGSNDGVDEQVVLERFDRLESLMQDVEQEIGLVQADLVNEDEMSDIVSNRSYRAVKHALETYDVITEEGKDDRE